MPASSIIVKSMFLRKAFMRCEVHLNHQCHLRINLKRQTHRHTNDQILHSTEAQQHSPACGDTIDFLLIRGIVRSQSIS